MNIPATSQPAAGPAGTPATEPGGPPRNVEAEQAVIGAILFDNSVYTNLCDELRPDHFYDPVHARIYEAAAHLISGGNIADGTTLREKFDRDGALKEVGGARYLLSLIDRAAFLTAQAEAYIAIIIDLALKRELIRVGSELSDKAVAGDQRGQDILEQSERRLFALADTGRGNRDFKTFGEALKGSLQMAASAIRQGGGISGVATGLRQMDRMLGGLHKSDLIILAGRPSMGKTALATNIALNIARSYGRTRNRNGEETQTGGIVGFFSLEMSAEQLAMRLMSEEARIESERIRTGKLNDAEFGKLASAVQRMENYPLYIDETGGISISALTSRARRLQRTRGLDVLIVDYLQLVTASGTKRTDGRVQEVSEITQGLKALAKDLKIPVIALSQLSRQVENREDKKPQLSDLRESGSIEQDADVVMFVYREAYYLQRAEPRPHTPEHEEWERRYEELYSQAEVIIGKQRHGPIGTIRLAFEPSFTQFRDLDEDAGDTHDHG
jgi:replicative DNA helicase